MEKILKELKPEERENLEAIKKKDSELFQLVIKKLVRFRIAAASGNLKIWEKIKKEEERNMKILLEALEGKNKTEELKERIKSI